MGRTIKTHKTFLIILASLLLFGCSTNQHPNINAYQAMADLSDTVVQLSNSHTIFYETRKINNRFVTNSSYSTRKRSLKHSFNMNPNAITHKIPTQQAIIEIGIFSYHKADLFGIGDNIYKLTGKVTLQTDTDKHYKINGVNNENYSMIWIEESDSGIIVSDVIKSDKATAADVQTIISEKQRQHQEKLRVNAIQAKEKEELLDKTISFNKAGNCKPNIKALDSPTIYAYAKLLFESKYHTEALTCFLNIANNDDSPPETFKYLNIIYDIGLGTNPDDGKANYWMEKYQSATQLENP